MTTVGSSSSSPTQQRGSCCTGSRPTDQRTDEFAAAA